MRAFASLLILAALALPFGGAGASSSGVQSVQDRTVVVETGRDAAVELASVPVGHTFLPAPSGEAPPRAGVTETSEPEAATACCVLGGPRPPRSADGARITARPGPGPGHLTALAAHPSTAPPHIA